MNNVEHDQVIALVVDQDNGAFIEPDELRSNARLIAAAPELLEALEFIRKELVQHTEHSLKGNPVFYAVNTARDAIAKALGTT